LLLTFLKQSLPVSARKPVFHTPAALRVAGKPWSIPMANADKKRPSHEVFLVDGKGEIGPLGPMTTAKDSTSLSWPSP
jgi:hypothetical protein